MFKEGILKDDWVQTVVGGGGLPIVETPPPDSLEYGYKAVAHYEQRGSQIVKVWDIQPWTEQDWENARRDAAQTTAEESTLEVNPNA